MILAFAGVGVLWPEVGVHARATEDVMAGTATESV